MIWIQPQIFLIFFIRELWFSNFRFGKIGCLVMKAMQRITIPLGVAHSFTTMCIEPSTNTSSSSATTSFSTCRYHGR